MSRILFIISCINGQALAGDSCAPLKVIKNATHKCYIYKDNTVSTYSKGTDGPEQEEIYIQVRKTGDDEAMLCRKEREGLKIYLPERAFKELCKNRVILFDTMSGPGTSSFVVFDTDSGKKRFEDRYNDEPIDIQTDKIIYFSESKQIKEEKCPVDKTVGVGCKEVTKTSLDLQTFKKVLLGQKKILPLQ